MNRHEYYRKGFTSIVFLSVVFCTVTLLCCLTFFGEQLYATMADARNRPDKTIQSNSEVREKLSGKAIKAKGVPKENRGVYLGRVSSAVRTHYNFNNFFHEDFTLTAWVMPQYPNAYMGPIFSNSGSGVFLAGQGEYRSGTGGFKKLGHPVFFMQVGTQRVKYLVSDWKANQWVHIAITRSNNLMSLYVNGKRKYPKTISDKTVTGTASEIRVPSSTSGNYNLKPGGVLYFGTTNASLNHTINSLDKIKTSKSDISDIQSANSNRINLDDITIKKPAFNAIFLKQKIDATPKYNSERYDYRDYQFYGVIDDVGIFDRALHPWVIGTLHSGANKRLKGSENNLIAGWGFDPQESSKKILPPKLNQYWQPIKTASVPISTSRASDGDAKATFNNPLIIGVTNAEWHLPFKKNEVWKVGQGYDTASESHNGFAAFAYDFSRAEGSTKNMPVYATANARVGCYKMGVSRPICSNGACPSEKNWVRLRVSNNEYASYVHLVKDSQHPVINGGVASEDVKNEFFCFDGDSGHFFGQYEEVAKVGVNANHLHFGLTPRGIGGITIPIAFVNYRVSDDNGETWYHILRGHPKKGQWIKRIQ